MLQLLVFVLVLGTWGFAEALEPLKLYDNFDQALINPDKWRGDQFQTGGFYQELVRKITPEEHHLRLLNRSYGNTFSYSGNTLNLFRLAFTRPDTITAIRSRVQVRNVESTGCPDLTPTQASAQIFGFFFNTNATVLGDATSDVIAGVAVRRRSDSPAPLNILEIFYFVGHCIDPNCVESPFLGSGLLGTVTTGEWVSLLVQWDKDHHRFIFQRDREQPVFVTYTGFSPVPPGVQLKTLDAANFVASCSGSGRPVGMVDALFDNVFVNQSALP
jgi:hypothetical protein